MSSRPPFEVDLGDGDDLEVSGWDALENHADVAAKRQFQQQLDHATLYRQCFASGAGRYVLEDLINCFFKARIVDPADPPGSQVSGIRQGQADVVKRIFHMIEFANTGGKMTGPGVPTEE